MLAAVRRDNLAPRRRDRCLASGLPFTASSAILLESPRKLFKGAPILRISCAHGLAGKPKSVAALAILPWPVVCRVGALSP
jgi:hypothetical protein